ncbi:MAG TPA: kynureninase [Myxococcota bacterium]|nr:kynureninase [Myxococcota bacterium]
MSRPLLTRADALDLDDTDPLAHYRRQFLLPERPDGQPWVYLAGNSLGLQPRNTRAFVEAELRDWARLGVKGHFHAEHPWMPYHENVTAQTARLVGARPIEVVVMNTLTVNLHLMLASFYRPTRQRHRILMEGGAFPSDQYALASQARWHGLDPANTVVELTPRPEEASLRTEDILSRIEAEGERLALVLLGSVNYLTGQAFDIPAITRAGHRVGAVVGFDLAHGAGNLPVALHDAGPDFAVWCSYKYLNAGPGSLSGCFVHERHAHRPDLPRLAGWWGHDKATRFSMPHDFVPISGAEGWQLSNPPILQLAALRASMDLFDAAGMAALRHKSEALTGLLERLLEDTPRDRIEIITPRAPADRGAQLSLRVHRDARGLLDRLGAEGIVCDFREPNIIRAAPVPLYNTFTDVFRFAEALRHHVIA